MRQALRLPLELWLVAWDRAALAGEMVDHQLTFALAVRHKEVVLDVAFAAAANGRNSLVGVLYDELARFVSACGRGRLCLRVFVFACVPFRVCCADVWRVVCPPTHVCVLQGKVGRPFGEAWG